MPYHNEHSVRFNDPDKYIRIRRANDEFGKGIDVLYGILFVDEKGPRSGRTEIQAIRFDAKKFSAAEAKKKAQEFAKDKDMKIKKFEPAVEKLKECSLFVSRYNSIIYEETLTTEEMMKEVNDLWLATEKVISKAKSSVEQKILFELLDAKNSIEQAYVKLTDLYEKEIANVKDKK